jgi:hypothetical protein
VSKTLLHQTPGIELLATQLLSWPGLRLLKVSDKIGYLRKSALTPAPDTAILFLRVFALSGRNRNLGIYLVLQFLVRSPASHLLSRPFAHQTCHRLFTLPSLWFFSSFLVTLNVRHFNSQICHSILTPSLSRRSFPSTKRHRLHASSAKVEGCKHIAVDSFWFDFGQRTL